MKTVTFQVVDGVDKGRVFRDLPIPVTIGREEGNLLRLNDERVSRYHAKVQVDSDDFILTDNGVVQKLRLEQDTGSDPLAMVIIAQTGGDASAHLEKRSRQFRPSPRGRFHRITPHRHTCYLSNVGAAHIIVHVELRQPVGIQVWLLVPSRPRTSLGHPR